MYKTRVHHRDITVNQLFLYFWQKSISITCKKTRKTEGVTKYNIKRIVDSVWLKNMFSSFLRDGKSFSQAWGWSEGYCIYSAGL